MIDTLQSTDIDLRLKVPAANIRSIRAGKRLMIHQGGRGSRKTYGNLDTLIYLMAEQKDKNLLSSVVSETMPHLKRGVMRDFESLLHIYRLWPVIDHNKTDHKYRLFGNTIEFFSADSPDRVRGPRRDYLFVNEANNISFDAFDQLKGRTAQATFIDFNPVSEFYVHQEILPNPEAFNFSFTVSTYLDNPYLPEGERQDIEAKRKLAEKSQYWANWWRVYGEGQVGYLEGVIFDNWTQIEVVPDGGKVVYGLDFGFTNDPTALIKVVIKDNDLYLDEIAYRTQLLNRDIARIIKQAGVRNDEVYADSAEPKSIEEIFLAGVNIKPAIKGPGSVNAGIDKLKSYNLHVTKRSLNLIKELRNYAWVTDKAGKATNKPSDAFNHAIDAVRYAIFRDDPPKTTDPEKVKNMFF